MGITSREWNRVHYVAVKVHENSYIMGRISGIITGVVGYGCDMCSVAHYITDGMEWNMLRVHTNIFKFRKIKKLLTKYYNDICEFIFM